MQRELSLLHNLFEDAPDAIILVDGTGRITRTNHMAETLFGYERSELIGKAVEELIPLSLRSRHIELRSSYMRAPEVRAMGSGRNLACLHKSGREVPVDIMLSPIVDEASPEKKLVLAVVRDATERRKNETSIERSEAIFRALFDQAPDVVLAVDSAGKIVRANNKCQSMLGYAVDELCGQSVDILVPQAIRGHHAGLREGFSRMPTTRPMGVGLQLCARHKDGSEVPVDIMLSPVQVPGEQFVICVVRDITERRHAERELQEHAEKVKRSNEELERFAYVASHDLQEPLRAVASSCAMIGKRLADKLDSDTDEYLHYAVDGAKRMQELINDLLAYSRIGRKQDVREIDLNAVLERSLQNLQTRIESTKAEIVRDKLPRLKGDFTQLSQVFQNLIGNALKFHGTERPHIQITAKRDGAFWLFAVRDNGIGMKPEYLEKIFVIFQRLHRRDEYPGTGIGLAICKKAIEQHGGRIWVESAVGKGSVFYFTLPA